MRLRWPWCIFFDVIQGLLGDRIAHALPPCNAARIPAATYNALIDAAADCQRRQRDQFGNNSPAAGGDLGTVLLQNNSGSAVDCFAVLGIDSALFTPTDANGDLAARIALAGITPALATHAGRFAITLEPIAAGAIGQAAVAGVCPVQVNIQTAGDGFADVNDGDATSLKSGSSGAATILWVASGTGVQWAVVRFGGGGGGGGLPSNAGKSKYMVMQLSGDNTDTTDNPALDTWDWTRFHA